MNKPRVTSTNHLLPFDQLSPDQFERLCLWLVRREGYLRPEHYGQAGSDQGRDVVAYRSVPAGESTPAGEELWYFQCKRYKRLSAATLKAEVAKCAGLAKSAPPKHPFGIVFVTSASLTARARDEISHCCEQNGFAVEFWASTELDMRVKAHSGLVQEFFDAKFIPVLTSEDDARAKKSKLSGPRLSVTSGGRKGQRPAPAPILSKLYPPGGPVPVDAAFYIPRAADLEAHQSLSEMPFTMLVVGPAQSGKSSLLARLERAAREKGVATVSFDPRVALPIRGRKSTGRFEIGSRAAMLLSQKLQSEWGLAPPRYGQTDSLINLSLQILRACENPRVRLLILDDLASLGDAADEWMLFFVRELHHGRATSSLPLSIAVGMTHHPSPHFFGKLVLESSAVCWWPRIDLGWFEASEAACLEERVMGSDRTSTLLFETFQGQPYLTHAAAADPVFREAVVKWMQDRSPMNGGAVRATLPYRRHLAAICGKIAGPMSYGHGLGQRLLRSFIDGCSGKIPIHLNDRRFLEATKLLAGSNGADSATRSRPALLLYELFVEDLEETLKRTSHTER